MFQRKKERGRILLSSVNVIECANIGSVPGGSSCDLNNSSDNNSKTAKTNSFNNLTNLTVSNPTPVIGYALQVCYTDNGQHYTLYLVAKREQDRDDWITVLRSG